MTRPATVSVAGFLILASSAMLGIWGLVTLLKFGAFTKAVRTIFDADVNADTSVGWLRITFVAGALLSVVLGAALLVLATGTFQGQNWARITTWLLSAGTAPVLWSTYIRNGVSYINAVGTGPSDNVARAEMEQVNALTGWRFSGWYHNITIGFGISTFIFLLCAIVLLGIPPSGSYFSRDS